MSNQSPSTSDMTNCSETGNNNLIGCKPIETFKWTLRLEKCLLRNMAGLKPSGINKHLSMLLLKKKMYKELKLNIPIKVLWNYMSTKWDIRAADCIESIHFDTSEKDFVLPEDFDQLIDEEGEKIKNLNKECLNDEINERKLLYWSGTTRSKSNSMSSVDSKEDLNEIIPSTLLQSSPAKTNEVGSDDGSCTRRSMSTNDELENSKSDEKNKLKHLKHFNIKTSNKSKSMDKIEVKAKIRNRVTSDLLVVQQSLDNMQSLGKRSCSKKNS
ncbi:MRG/MORF4L-binding protein-like [Metopolophium dirhodum]|uniref:MRG/MORF4L-binding protein-like n=1 Tax=Metopolophium dirhodum TaxID=44670 RepID=UPI00298F48AA|nr:MRG/MORF4L-binding protein-like [Metopolophium dirhodum]